jgi:hypothetical protein
MTPETEARQQIDQKLVQAGWIIQDMKRLDLSAGLGIAVRAAQVAAHRTRDSKDILSHEEVVERHHSLAAKFGNQPKHVVAQAREREHKVEQQPEKMAQQSMTYSRNHIFERSAVQDERSILQTAMDRSMGQATYSQVRQEFNQRGRNGEFLKIERSDGRAAPLYTTAEMVRLENVQSRS